MAKILRFAQYFPYYHLKTKQRTHFVEGFYNSIGVNYGTREYFQKLKELNKTNLDLGKITEDDLFTFWSKLDVNFKMVKKHTIRKKTKKGQDNYKLGQIVSPRTWHGKAYQSPNIVLWDNIEILSNTPFVATMGGSYYIDTNGLSEEEIVIVANNDCLDVEDFRNWFCEGIMGQIVAWVKVDYLK